MKKLHLILAACSMLFAFASCGGMDDPYYSDGPDETNLYGKWREGSVYEIYYDDGTGITWDEADDVSEDEGQWYDWTLEGKTLIQEHYTVFGSVVPKVYTVKQLTNSTLRYEDDYGQNHRFIKVH